MRTMPITKNENANISIDFLAAVAVLLIAFLFAIIAVYNMMAPYSGYTKELYPTADRAMNLLIQNEGKWESENSGGQNWETIWDGNNQSNVQKIGFLENKNTNILLDFKLNALMESGGENWWEYPTSAVTEVELDNASRALGLERYNFYMQVRPIKVSIYNETAANEKSIEAVGDRGDVVSIVRYGTLGKFAYGDFDGAYLFGFKDEDKSIASKPLFGLDQANFTRVIFSQTPNGIKFSIVNWTVEGDNAQIQNIQIGTETQDKSFKIAKPEKLKGGQFTIWRNETEFILGDNQANINMPVDSNDTKVTFFIPVETLTDELGNWLYAENVFVEINVNNLEVHDGGVTWFSNTFGSNMFAVKTILWVW